MCEYVFAPELKCVFETNYILMMLDYYSRRMVEYVCVISTADVCMLLLFTSVWIE